MKKTIIAVIVLSIAAVSFLAGGWYGKGGPSGSGAARKVLYYVDPMNPAFRTDKPGIAPCGMPLEPVYADSGPTGGASVAPGTVSVSPSRQQLIGVKVATVERKPSSHTLRLYGKVAADERRVYRLNASTDSWVRELSGTTTGSLVDKDEILAEMLAPAFFNAQQNYLIQLGQMDRIRQQIGGELRPQQTEIADSQIRMALQSLQTLGISDAQIAELAKTRKARPYLQVRSPVKGVVMSRNITLQQWFKAGEEFYRIADIRKVWVYADVYENEARFIRPGMTVRVAQAQAGKTFSAKVSEVLPLFDPASKTIKVRFEVDNPIYDLRPDMFVDVEMAISLPPSITVPADAVIDKGLKKIVYVDRGDGSFEPRRVETGWRLGRQVEITGGLMPGEKVVAAGNFLIDSESRMRVAGLGSFAESAQDPVCRMYVDEEKAKAAGKTTQEKGLTYFFCSAECKQEFHKNPAKYIGKSAGPQAAMPAGERHDTHGSHGTGKTKDKSKVSAKHADERTMKHKGMDVESESKAASPGMAQEGQQEPSKGRLPFPGAQYLGTVERVQEPAEDEPEDEADGSKPTGHYEVPMAPPSGTQLK